MLSDDEVDALIDSVDPSFHPDPRAIFRAGMRKAAEIADQYADTFGDPLLRSVTQGTANYIRTAAGDTP